MKCCMVILLLLVVGCSVTKTIDESKAGFIASAALSDWLEENPADADQIEGASVSDISTEGKLIHVTLKKEISRGAHYFHDAYFHVYLNWKYQVVKVVRGPDAIS
ncbi:MAG: hypothetical protein VB862_05145 [Pirellulaceae bacterium]